MARKWAGSWAGGRFFLDARGRKVWVIERQVGGVRMAPSLGPVSEGEALAELALFDRDPDGYRSRTASRVKVKADAVEITEKAVAGFLKHLKARDRSKKYRRDCHRYLVTWSEVLERKGKTNLRTNTVADYRAALEDMEGAELQRIATLKSFCSYLRGLGKFGNERDATLDLAVPQAAPEKAVRPKGYPVKVVEQLYRFTADQAVRDLIRLRATCGGMHHTEIERVAVGLGVITPLEGQGEIAGTITFPHKNGTAHVVSVDAAGLAAAERLYARGVAPAENYVAKHIQQARDAAAASGIKIPHVAEGELRHSFITWAAARGREVKPNNAGLPMSLVSATVGHRSERTTRKFYLGAIIPPMIVVPVELYHPDDPVQLAPARAVSRQS